MDIDVSNITDLYNQYIKDTASNSSAPKVDTNKDYSKASDDELMDVCKQFESYFLEQCFKEMLKTVKTDESSSGATNTLVDYYKDEMVKKVSEQSTEKESLGLAQMLYEQMKRNYDL